MFTLRHHLPQYRETSILDCPGLRDCADHLFNLDFSCSCRGAQPGRHIGLRYAFGGNPAQYHLHRHCGFKIYRETRACRQCPQRNGIRRGRGRRHFHPTGFRMVGAPGWLLRELDSNPQGHHDPCQSMIRLPATPCPHAGHEIGDSKPPYMQLGSSHGERT